MDTRIADYTKVRDDLTTPHDCQAAYVVSDFGTDLAAIEPFTSELGVIVDRMKEELANERRILEGTEVPEYTPLTQNELSETESKEDQWRTLWLHGSSTTARSLISTPVSSTSSSSARPNTPVSDTLDSDVRSCPMLTGSCLEMSGACGCVTDATNECSECTVPTTSEPMRGTPSEQK